MTTYYEALPARKASKHSGIKWVPNDNQDVAPGRLPVAGELAIDTDRARVVYAVTEFPVCEWDGRGFFLEKTAGGGDKEESSYSCFVGRNGQDRRCECKGFAFAGHCKHLDSIFALVENGWL